MSLSRDCPSCMFGNHESHDAEWDIRPGLLGGSRCDCTGDCTQRRELNPLVGMWTKPNTPSGRFEKEKRGGDVFKGVRREN